MIKLHKNISYGSAAAEQSNKWRRAVRKCEPIPGVYVITVPENPNHMLEIYDLLQFQQPGMHYRDYIVVGIAIGRDEAFELVRRMTQEAYEKLGEANIIKYLGL